MKIAIIAHIKHPISQPFAGGLEAFTYDITVRLKELGHDVTLFASSASSPELPLISILSDKNYDKSGFRIRKPDLPSEYIAEHQAYFKLMMEIDSYGFDIIFNNSLHYIPIVMASIISTPMLTVLHTPPFYELSMAVAMERKNYGGIRYVTISECNANAWKEILGDCEVVPNGIDINQWNYYDAGEQESYAIWFGRIHPDKGLHHAIKAAKKAGIFLKIAGAAGDKRYFDNAIKPLLDQDTQLLGLLDHKLLNEAIGKANVAIVTPCWQEPFGLVVAEAMACGTPVAGFKMGALIEIITAETGYTVEYPDTEKLAIAIIEAQKLNRKTIRQYAKDHFDINRMLQKYEKLLASQIENVVVD